MAEFKIFRNIVSQAEFDLLADTLRETGQNIDSYLKDKEISANDIVGILGKLDGKDGYYSSDLATLKNKKGWDTIRALHEQVKKYGIHPLAMIKDKGFAYAKGLSVNHPDSHFMYVLAKASTEDYASVLVNMPDLTLYNRPDFLQALFDLYAFNYCYLPTDVMKRRQVQLAAIKADWRVIDVIKRVDKTFVLDEEFLIKAFQNEDLVLSVFISKLRNFNSGLPKTFIELAKPVFSSKKPKLLAKLALLHLDFLSFLSKEQIKKVWPIIKDNLTKKGIDFGTKMMTSYDSFKAGIKGFTHSPENFRTFENLYTVWKNNKQPIDPNDTRPSLLFFQSREDWNGAFKNGQLLNALIDCGKFRVFYHEGPDQHVLDETVWKRFTGDGKRLIHTSIIAAHGTGSTNQFGHVEGKDPGLFDPESKSFVDQKFVDITDFKDGDFNHVPKYLDPSGQMILESCSNGKGGATNKGNLVNLWADLLPRTFQIMGVQQDFSSIGRHSRESNRKITIGKKFRIQMTLPKHYSLYETMGKRKSI